MLVDSGFFKTVSTQDRRPWWPKQALPIVRTECWNADFEICITLVQITNAWIFMLIRRLTNHLHYFVYHCKSKQFSQTIIVCVNFLWDYGGYKIREWHLPNLLGVASQHFPVWSFPAEFEIFVIRTEITPELWKNILYTHSTLVNDIDNLSIRKIKGGTYVRFFL